MTWFWSRRGELALLVGAGVAGLAAGLIVSWWHCDGETNLTQPEHAQLYAQVATALDGHEQAAGQYAAFYSLLAKRFAAQHYSTTTRAAHVAGTAADILELPGLLEDIIATQLNPLLGKPGPLSAETSADVARRLQTLAAACQEVAQ